MEGISLTSLMSLIANIQGLKKKGENIVFNLKLQVILDKNGDLWIKIKSEEKP